MASLTNEQFRQVLFGRVPLSEIIGEKSLRDVDGEARRRAQMRREQLAEIQSIRAEVVQLSERYRGRR